MNDLQKKELTIKFQTEVNRLLETGTVKNYAEVIRKLGWSKTAFSGVMNGKTNVPTYIYAKFNEIFSKGLTGLELKNAIRGKGLTIEEAAEKLGISRQQLHYYLNKGKLPPDFLEKVKESLDISFSTPLTLTESGVLSMIAENAVRINAIVTVILSGLSGQPDFVAALKRKPTKEGNEVLSLVNQIVRKHLDKSK